jgi:hypothetical protein
MKNAANRLSAAANYDKINYGEMRFGAAQKNIMEVNDMKKIAAGLLALAIVFGAAADGAFLDSSAIAASAAAYTEDELKAKVADSSDYDMIDWAYDDFDGDGKKEGFGLFFGGAEALRETRYISSDGNVSIMRLGVSQMSVLDVGSNKKVVYVTGMNQGIFRFAVYGVENGEEYELPFSTDKNNNGRIEQDSEGFRYISYDERGNEIENYKIRYDEASGDFVEDDDEPITTTEDDIKEYLLMYVNEDSDSTWEINDWIYDDLDGDGKEEAVAVVKSNEAITRAYYISDGSIELLIEQTLGMMSEVVAIEGDGSDEMQTILSFGGKHWGFRSTVLFNVWSDGRAVQTKILQYKDGEFVEFDTSNGELLKEGDKYYFRVANISGNNADGTYEDYEVAYDYNFSAFIVVDDSIPDPAEDYTYEENEDGTITITAYTGSAEELIIPSEIDGKAVAEIGHDLFDFVNGGNKTIKKITIPSSVKKIDEGAFVWAESLEEVYIEDGVEDIGENAFAGCQKLKKITIPKSVEKIGKGAFDHTYHSDSDAIIDVTIYCYKDSAAHKFALGENDYNHEFAYVLLDEVSNPDPSSNSTVSADPSSTESGSSSGSTSTSTSSAAASSSGDKTSNPATGVAAGVSIAAVLAGGIIMVTKKTKK